VKNNDFEARQKNDDPLFDGTNRMIQFNSLPWPAVFKIISRHIFQYSLQELRGYSILKTGDAKLAPASAA